MSAQQKTLYDEIQAVRALYPGDHRSIFLTVPSKGMLRERLETRGESADRILKRLHTAEDELLRAGEFDRVVVNDDLTTALNDLRNIIQPLVP